MIIVEKVEKIEVSNIQQEFTIKEAEDENEK